MQFRPARVKKGYVPLPDGPDASFFNTADSRASPKLALD